MQFTDFDFIVLPLTVKICKINAIWYFSSLNGNVAKLMTHFLQRHVLVCLSQFLISEVKGLLSTRNALADVPFCISLYR